MSRTDNRLGRWYALGQVDYQTAWRWQQRLVSAYKRSLSESPDATNAHFEPDSTAIGLAGDLTRFEGDEVETLAQDRLLLLEHPPVYTLGQGADLAFLRFDPSGGEDELHRVERGGEVTYHCPGQLVGYPILNLKQHRQDLHWYLRQLEEVLIRSLAEFGLKGERVEGLTGVWIEGHKVAAIGIKVSRWITMHGFALNVCPALSGFKKIVPCGISDRPVGSLSMFLPEISVAAVQPVVVAQFAQVFQLRLLAGSPTCLRHWLDAAG